LIAEVEVVVVMEALTRVVEVEVEVEQLLFMELAVEVLVVLV
jgi:hypothetical protein